MHADNVVIKDAGRQRATIRLVITVYVNLTGKNRFKRMMMQMVCQRILVHLYLNV